MVPVFTQIKNFNTARKMDDYPYPIISYIAFVQIAICYDFLSYQFAPRTALSLSPQSKLPA